MKPPRSSLRNDPSAVSEVVGTILILGMTVSLFAVIIIWVTSMPTPEAATRVDLDGQYTSLPPSGVGVNITITHRGGEALSYATTRVYLVFEKASGTRTTEILRLKGTITYGPNAGDAYGLIDGNDNTWNINERWSIVNKTVQPTDRITAEVVDTSMSVILWSEQLLGAAGSHPPIFLEKWADRDPETSTLEVPWTGASFAIYASIRDEDHDLKSVNGTLTIFYGTPSPCKNPQKMFDDGTNGDKLAGDGIWTLSRECMWPTNLSWDGSIVLFTATDGTFLTTSRMVLHVVLGPGGIPSPDQNQTSSGRPPNLRYNGLQGYNIFNASQWDSKEFAAAETRTFKGNERVVVVVGSLLLRDVAGKDEFYLYDPYGGATPQPVVYGTSKVPTYTTKPSNLQAFKFYKQVNGYNIFLFRFDLNNASSTGINYYRNPVHPPYYFFARYSVLIDVMDAYGTRFNTTDAINITDTDGYMRQFPLIETYKDSGFTQKSHSFLSTDRMYVAVFMFTVDGGTDAVTFGTLSIRDYLGGTQVLKAFANGRDSNPPLCPVTGACTGRALSVNGATITYRFMVNLTLSDQDPWVEGAQNYAMVLSYVDDADETYSGLAKQVVITAPLFRLDVVGGNADTTGPAWGTHDYGYYYENLNGLDKWRKTRYEYCGLPGTGSCKNAETRSVAFLDADLDGDLDIAASVKLDNNNAEINYYRRDLDFTGNVIFSKFTLTTLSGNNLFCADLATADLTGDGYPELVCGLTNGYLWYFKADGTWTSGSPSAAVKVDETRASVIHGVTIGDFNRDGGKDIAVAREDATVTYYLNLDGLGTFSTGATSSRHFAEGEVTSVGTVTVPDYLKTFAADDVWEQIEEALQTEGTQSGNTTNPSFDSTLTPWAYADWEDPTYVDGQRSSSGGNPGGLVYVQMNFHATTTVSGYWYQAFTVSGSTPFTATVKFDRKVSTWLSSGSATLYVYVFVDATSGAPNVANAIQTYTHTGTAAWASSGTISVPSGRLPTAGTYYLKIAARVTYPASGAGSITAQFDNAQLNWSSTGGQASELKHYWRMQQIPNRPMSTYSLRMEAHRSTSTDGDTFVLAYATDVTGGNPTTGTYTTVLWINSTSDLVQTYTFPVSLQNKIVWIRVVDTNHTVGGYNLDKVFVDQMYIEVTTQPIAPGSTISLPAPNPGAATSIDSDDQNGDGYYDVFTGTNQGKVFKLSGGSGGLQTPTAAFISVGASNTIVGVKLANITPAGTGLEVVIGYGTSVGIYSGQSGGQIGSTMTVSASWGGPDPITSLGAGDVDGDGDDDIVAATGQGNPNGPGIVYFRNLNPGTGTVWTQYPIEPMPPGSKIALFDIDLGDGNKSQYRGR